MLQLRFSRTRLLAGLALLVGVIGCSSESAGPAAKPQAEGEAAAADDGASASTEADASAEFVLGNALPKFDPPTLAELDKLTWTNSPVRDAMQVMREERAKEGEPSATVEEALALKNDSPGNNQKIKAALGVLAPEDGSGVDFNAKLVRHTPGDVNSTNPLFSSSVTDADLNDLTCMYLINFDKQLRYFAPSELVESWQTSEDHMIDRFKLRTDLTWSDGKPFTAHDVEFTFRLIMTDHPLLVIPAIRESGVNQIKYMKAYDDNTLVVFHNEPAATNWGNMNFPIMPKHIYEVSAPEDPSLKRSARHTELEDHPVYLGPYEFVSRKRAEEFVVRRREGYFMHEGKEVRPKPYFAEIRVKTIEDMNTAMLAFKAGDIQQMELRAEQWESQTKDDAFYKVNTKAIAPEWSEFHVVWNVKSPYFNDNRVRWAMTYAYDYDELLNVICRGIYEPCRGTFHPTAWMFPKDAPQAVKQDLDKAEDLLDEAGWVDSDGDGIRDKEIDGKVVPFEFQLMTGVTETAIQAATLMKENLEQIGITVNVKPTEFVVMQDKELKHEFDAVLGGWLAGTDPDMQQNIYGTGTQRNYGQYSNAEVDQLFLDGRREFDQDKRAEIYGKIHMLLWEDQPVTWLFYRPGLFAFNKQLRGYNFGALGPFKYSPGFFSLYIPEATP